MSLQPTVKVSKEELVQVLTEVSPGLSPRPINEQSDCYVFKGGKVYTFNEEVFCAGITKFPKEFVGAVKAPPLDKLLNKRQEDSFDIQFTDSKINISNKGKKTWMKLETNILLALNAVEAPEQWLKLNEDFTDAVGIVESCAGKDQSAYKLTCVHIHPNFIEACDNFQISRYVIKTGVKVPFLVEAGALRHILKYDVNEFAETDNWLHFRRGQQYWISVKKHKDPYDDLSDYLKVTGSAAVLPKTLDLAVETAEIFTSENADEAQNQVLVQGKNGQMMISGVGDSGGHAELKRLMYKGPPFAFKVAPRLLVELVKRHTRCEINPQEYRLKVNGGKFIYIACLEKTDGQTVKES